MTTHSRQFSPLSRIKRLCIFFTILFCTHTHISARENYSTTFQARNIVHYIYDDMYYGDYEAYESSVYDAFETSAPMSVSSIGGPVGQTPGYKDSGLGDINPGNPGQIESPIGEGSVLFMLAALTAICIFIKQRKSTQTIND